MMREVTDTLVDGDRGTEDVPLLKSLDTLSRDGIPQKKVSQQLHIPETQHQPAQRLLPHSGVGELRGRVRPRRQPQCHLPGVPTLLEGPLRGGMEFHPLSGYSSGVIAIILSPHSQPPTPNMYWSLRS